MMHSITCKKWLWTCQTSYIQFVPIQTWSVSAVSENCWRTWTELLSYDTTFQLGDFYVSVLCFRHTLFKEAPVIPAAFLVHERKF